MLRQTTIGIMPKEDELNDKWILTHEGEIISVAQSTNGFRENNEDCYGVFQNQEDPNLILSVVCDGVGGRDRGEIASSYTVQKLGEFFRTVKPTIINNPYNLNSLLSQMISDIHNNIPAGLTTLTSAITLGEDLLIINMGDSRTYGYENGKLTQLTDDDSEVWPLYKNGLLKKSDLRFLSNNNVIYNALGGQMNYTYHARLIKENPYEAILLTTDGIHDILSDTQMSDIIEKKGIVEAVPALISASVDYDNQDSLSTEDLSRIKAVSKEHVNRFLLPGHDNATAVLTLIKKK